MSDKRDNIFLQSADHTSNTTGYLIGPVCNESTHSYPPEPQSPSPWTVPVRGAEGLRVVPAGKAGDHEATVKGAFSCDKTFCHTGTFSCFQFMSLMTLNMCEREVPTASTQRSVGISASPPQSGCAAELKSASRSLPPS